MDTRACVSDRDQERPCERAGHRGLARGSDIVRPDPGPGGSWARSGPLRGACPLTSDFAFKSLRLAGLVVLTAAAGIAPWIVRNALVHGEFVAIKSTFGYAFWQGNCALSEGTDKVVRPSVEQVLDKGKDQSGLAALNRRLWAARHEAGYIDDIALTREDLKQLGTVSEPERSRILFRRAIHELRDQPGRYSQLCLRRFRYFWLFDETNPKSASGLTGSAIWYSPWPPCLGWGSPRATSAAGCGRRSRRRCLISLFHALTIVSARFHIPIEPLMAVWAGAGLSRLGAEPARSAAARDHVVGVGFERRLVSPRTGPPAPRASLSASARLPRTRLVIKAAVLIRECASPCDRDDRHVVGMRVGNAHRGHPGRRAPRRWEHPLRSRPRSRRPAPDRVLEAGKPISMARSRS